VCSWLLVVVVVVVEIQELRIKIWVVKLIGNFPRFFFPDSKLFTHLLMRIAFSRRILSSFIKSLPRLIFLRYSCFFFFFPFRFFPFNKSLLIMLKRVMKSCRNYQLECVMHVKYQTLTRLKKSVCSETIEIQQGISTG